MSFLGEDTLRKVLELINGSDLVIDNFIHVASIWGHASKHSRLIDDFYFSSIYCEHKSTILHLLAENSDCEAIQGILTHIKKNIQIDLVVFLMLRISIILPHYIQLFMVET